MYSLQIMLRWSQKNYNLRDKNLILQTAFPINLSFMLLIFVDHHALSKLRCSVDALLLQQILPFKQSLLVNIKVKWLTSNQTVYPICK